VVHHKQDPDKSIGFLVNDVQRLLRRNFNRRAQTLGLSQSQWQVLAHLARREGMNQVTLADILDIQPITLVRQIDRLQEAGLVARRPDPDDRRAVQLYLTPDAQPLLDQMWALAVEARADALAGVSEKDQEALIETLCRIKRNLLAADAADAEEKERTAANGNRNA